MYKKLIPVTFLLFALLACHKEKDENKTTLDKFERLTSGQWFLESGDSNIEAIDFNHNLSYTLSVPTSNHQHDTIKCSGEWSLLNDTINLSSIKIISMNWLTSEAIINNSGSLMTIQEGKPLGLIYGLKKEGLGQISPDTVSIEKYINDKQQTPSPENPTKWIIEKLTKESLILKTASDTLFFSHRE